ncbi:MAG: aldehyde dehydrogenase family protein, partial [Solirubrobacterales bacterium]|nr:aldehyde dehydrogenase family protein [Solirubrobacterales bacterium]
MAYANLIAGEWVHGDEAAPDVNPSDTADVVGEYDRASRAQVDDAIAAARQAFPSWSRTTPQQRADLLDKVGTE